MLRTSDKPVVYIVDDEESVRKAFTLLMRSAGMPCCAFCCAEQFLAEVDAQQEGCVLLDITMPHLTGLQLQNELNRRELNLPVIAISARDDVETSQLARQLGAKFFLRKPVDDQALIDAIHWVLESNSPQNANGSAPSPATQTESRGTI
jgi:two-component system response regulator FixJ